jgi:putative MATE family efflux protein
MNQNKELFENSKVSKAVWTLAVPTILAMLVTIVYNIADTFFIGQTGDTYQVAAISMAMPTFMVMMAFGSLFGTGGSSTISRNLGQGKLDRVKNVSAFSFYGALTVGIIAGGLMLIFIEPITAALGASADTSGFIQQYLSYIALGAPFIIISNAFGSIVRSEGNAKAAMVGMMIGTATNIILDPIMILVLGLGVSGAAIATVIGNIAATIYYIRYMQKDTTAMSVSPKEFKASDGILTDVVSIGIPGALNSLLMSVAMIFLNLYLASYGDYAVAAMGVASKGSMVIAMLLIGFAMGAQPLLGYSYGAKNKERLSQIIKYCITVTVIAGSAVAAIFFAISPQVVQAFIDDPAIIDIGTKMFRAVITTGPILGIYFVSMMTIQAMGKARSSLILTICRQGLAFVPAIIIGNALLGLDGLIWAQPIADLVSAILGFSLLRRNLQQMGEDTQGTMTAEPAFSNKAS